MSISDKVLGKAVTVAMSGGVDSTTTAALLKQAGCDVRGVFMALAQPDLQVQVEKVKGIAARLEIPLEVIDLNTQFQKEVLDYFASSYFMGKTPNPCIVCNREIKFGLLMNRALESGGEYFATGHYVRVQQNTDGIFKLLKGLDRKKDQSYFLCRLTQEQLSRLVFPLGGFIKDHVYEIAAGFGFTGFHKGKESQDVCFLAETSVGDFLAATGKDQENTGEIVTMEGRVLGRHEGIHRFTVGQRRGLGIPDSTPYYVLDLDAQNNQVVVGKDTDLWHDSMIVKEMNWLSGKAPELPAQFTVKIRYRHQAAAANVEMLADNRLEISFNDRQRAITKGQFAALYDGEELIGGGEILLKG
ncbi:MAG: tRNA 2-thiouridine(34) synthase MnmA [Proteobacteria bacterium]|nr:tRNA 2-thiouridine(34) synthase MnmA [Pseudomonadota bacterium]MBU1710748.1 tRNA 2-thiouridine(34) synthase MnmA [Pseudomonadota bacterium]